MNDSYCYFRVRSEGRDHGTLVRRLRAETLPAWRAEGIACWGLWRGLFGVASNELLVMATAPGERELAPHAAALPDGAALVDTLEVESTVRPGTAEPLTADGLYVFRFFDVALENCDEIVALSRRAWETFEAGEGYASRPLGLFRPRERVEQPEHAPRMLLVTWYDGFASWERSRIPPAEARESFRRRHELTGGTIACAAQLLPAV